MTRSPLRRQLLGGIAACGLAPPWRAAAALPPALRRLRLATGTEPDADDGRWLRQVYAAVLAPLGYALDAVQMPARRAEASLAAGTIDGEMLRSDDYVRAHPGIVRVDFSLTTESIGLYGAAAPPRPVALDELLRQGHGVVFRRGVVGCQRRLLGALPRAGVAEVTTTQSGIAMVLNRRVDYFCELDESVQHATADARPPIALVRLGSLVPALPLYPCLHARHAALAPRLAEAFREFERRGGLDGGRRFRQGR